MDELWLEAGRATATIVRVGGEARASGWGGLEAVAKITGYARSTLGRGLKELDAEPFAPRWVRQPGGGRRSLASDDEQPVSSVDTKEKELVGNYKNGGSDYHPKGDPQRAKVHDFEDKELGKTAPYGVYDITANTGFVGVGITADTAVFAVASIHRWFDQMGRERSRTPAS